MDPRPSVHYHVISICLHNYGKKVQNYKNYIQQEIIHFCEIHIYVEHKDTQLCHEVIAKLDLRLVTMCKIYKEIRKN